MKILMYHKNLCHSEQDILDRATQKKHMLRKTIYWDILLFLLAGIGGTLLFLYSPVLMKIPVFYAFVPVRNSIWENLKLLYMPAVLTGMIRYLFLLVFVGKSHDCVVICWLSVLESRCC